jgi:RNA polymerase sigma-70 factor, ECF subfamily
MKSPKKRRPIDPSGDFSRFIFENEKKLTSIAYRLTGNMEDARDLVQESLLRACERYDRFDGRNLGGWIYTIIRNLWTDHCRTAKYRERARPLFTSREFLREDSSDRAELCIVLQDVLKLLSELPKKQRTALMMRSNGSSYREMARRQRMPVGTVKASVSYGRALLAEAL